MIRATGPFALLFAALAPLAIAQDTADESPVALAVERTVTTKLDAGDSHDYVIAADAAQFVHGAADQLSVDVILTVFGPDDAQLAKFDGPAVGPETFSFETEAAGRYRIEVTPFEGAEGDYAITLTTLEPIAETGPERADQLMAPFGGEDTPGGVVAVVRGGEVLYSKAYGMANLVHGVPFTTGTPTNLGSTSKQFTAFAIALLDSEGALSLDDDVREHIPELPELGATVTLRNLLTHTSGYREFLNTVAMAGRRLDEGDHIGRDELIEIVQRQPELQNSPGSEWNYNNTGYGLLTVVVERVTGATFPEWMAQRVFEPLGMVNTKVRAHRAQLVRGSAQGYVGAAEGYREGRDLGGAMGAGGIYSTVGDMTKWMRNLQTGELGGEGVIGAMTTAFELTTGKSTGYGFGLFVDEQRSLRRFHHGGADTAHRAMLMIFPDIEAGVVALSNNASFNANGISGKIAEAFFREHMEFADETGVTEASADADGTFDPASYEPAEFDAVVGRYELEEVPGFVLTFTRREDRFFTQATGQSELEIMPTSPLTFALDKVDAEITFHRDAEGRISSLTLHQNGDHAAQRLEEEPWAPAAEELASYAGRYYSDELETFYTVAALEGHLVLQHRRLEDARLTPSKEHEFTGKFPIAGLTFVVTDTGEVTGFDASNGRTRDVRFTRFP